MKFCEFHFLPTFCDFFSSVFCVHRKLGTLIYERWGHGGLCYIKENSHHLSSVNVPSMVTVKAKGLTFARQV